MIPLSPGLWLMEPTAFRRLAARREVSLPGIDLDEPPGDGPGDPARSYAVRDGVAVLPLAGTIYPRPSLEWWFDGMVDGAAVALDHFNAALDAALADPRVRSILLDVDSPGGLATGVAETADRVRAADARKPTAAYVRDTAASAAYWIATAAGEVVAHPTARLGSIGVLGVAYDDTERLAKAGIRRKVIVSDQSPNKALDPFTDAGELALKREFNALADRFVAAVARHLGVPEPDVLTDFGGGDVLPAPEAVEVGMAHRLGSAADAHARLAARSAAPTAFRVLPAASRAAAAAPRIRFGVR